jgi:hypothetical protein
MYVYVYVCVCQSKANKKPDIDALAVCKIVSEEDDRRETNVRPVGCCMDPNDGHAVFREPSQLLQSQLSCDIAWTTQLSFHSCYYGIIVSCPYSPWATCIHKWRRSWHFLSHGDAVETHQRFGDIDQGDVVRIPVR